MSQISYHIATPRIDKLTMRMIDRIMEIITILKCAWNIKITRKVIASQENNAQIRSKLGIKCTLKKIKNARRNGAIYLEQWQ